jgi:AcrR family transcriptional regulator
MSLLLIIERGVHQYADSLSSSMNAMSSDRRRYRLKARAVRQHETHDRIVAATVALHREVGPARTTVADVARRAGVERLTVYNHFPSLQELLASCQRHFLQGSPPPPLLPPPAGDPRLRLERALADRYRWFRANEAMERHVHRDRALVRELDELLRGTLDPMLYEAAETHARALAAGRRAGAGTTALVRLAFDFTTWDIVTGQGLGDAAAARLLRHAVESAASGSTVSAVSGGSARSSRADRRSRRPRS